MLLITGVLVCKGFSLSKQENQSVLRTQAEQKIHRREKNVASGIRGDFYSQYFLEGSFLSPFNLKRTEGGNCILNVMS